MKTWKKETYIDASGCYRKPGDTYMDASGACMPMDWEV